MLKLFLHKSFQIFGLQIVRSKRQNGNLLNTFISFFMKVVNYTAVVNKISMSINFLLCLFLWVLALIFTTKFTTNVKLIKTQIPKQLQNDVIKNYYLTVQNY